MNTTLLRRELKYNLKLLLIFLTVLTLYTVIIISMFSPAMAKGLELMMTAMKPLMSAMGMGAQGSTLLDFLINYLFGFLYKIFPMVFFILLISRVLIRYVDRGTMAYLLATPNSRRKIVGTQALVIILELLIMLVYLSVLTVASSAVMFPGSLETVGFLRAMAGLFGLILFLSGICFLSGCIFSDAGKALSVGTAINVLFLLLQMIAQMGDKYAFLKYTTPLTLFDSTALAKGTADALPGVVILYLAGLVLYGAGIAVFERKDLSI